MQARKLLGKQKWKEFRSGYFVLFVLVQTTLCIQQHTLKLTLRAVLEDFVPSSCHILYFFSAIWQREFVIRDVQPSRRLRRVAH